MVDAIVRRLVGARVQHLDREAKTQLLGLLASTVRLGEETGPFMVALQRSVGSLSRCIQRLDEKLIFLEPCPTGEPSWTSVDTE